MRGRRGHEDDGWDRRDDAGRYPGPRGFGEEQQDRDWFGTDQGATQQYDARELGGQQQYDRSPYDGRGAEPRQHDGRRYDGAQLNGGPQAQGGAQLNGGQFNGGQLNGAQGQQSSGQPGSPNPGMNGGQGQYNGGRNNGTRYDRQPSARPGYPAAGSTAGPDSPAHGSNQVVGMEQQAGRELAPAAPTGARSRPYGRISIFTLLDDKVAEFDRLAEQVADAVRIAEPDTLVYVIHLVPKAPMQRIFYEIYRDRAAFESHERQPHNQRFAVERRSCVLATNIIELRLKYAKVAPLSPGGQGQRSPQSRQPVAQTPAPDRRMPQQGWGQPGAGGYSPRYGET